MARQQTTGNDFQKFDFNDTLGLPVGTGCLQVRKYLALYKRS